MGACQAAGTIAITGLATREAPVRAEKVGVGKHIENTKARYGAAEAEKRIMVENSRL